MSRVRGYPIVDADRRMRGVVTRNGLRKWLEDPHPVGKKLSEMARDPVTAYPDEPLRVVVYRMAETGLTFSLSSNGVRSEDWQG